MLTFRLPNDYFTIVAQTSRERDLVYRGKQVGFNDSKFPFPSLLMLSQLVSRARASFDSWRGD